MTQSKKLHDYQLVAVRHCLDRLFTKDAKGAGLWLGCGLGKTAVTLHAILELIALGEIRKTLIAAPARVIQTVWEQEAEEWNLPLTFELVHCTPKARIAALSRTADIYLTSYGLLDWMVGQKQFRPDLIVFDELSKVKNWSAKCTKAAKKLVSVTPKRLGLTATPTPNTLLEIFAPTFLLDDGESLGRTITNFRENYADRGGFMDRGWQIRPGVEDRLYQAVAPIYLRQSALDHLDMPELVIKTTKVKLSEPARKVYDEIEEELFSELESGEELFAGTAGGKYNLCRQIASGATYSEDKNSFEVLHNDKIEALKDSIEELNGKPVIIVYHYKHSFERLKKVFKRAPAINGDTSGKHCAQIISDWVAGKTPVLLCQPQSAGHGLDRLQKGGADMIWFDPTDQPEVHDQMIGRLYRQGSTSDQVCIQYLITTNTVEVPMQRRLTQKQNRQQTLLESIEEYREAKAI